LISKIFYLFVLEMFSNGLTSARRMKPGPSFQL
jgi:hypothetical protein